MSSINTVNNCGPKTDPCGTPLQTNFYSEKQLLTIYYMYTYIKNIYMFTDV